MFSPMNRRFSPSAPWVPSRQRCRALILFAKGVVGIPQLKQQFSQGVVTVVTELGESLIRNGCQQLHHLPMVTAMPKADGQSLQQPYRTWGASQAPLERPCTILLGGLDLEHIAVIAPEASVAAVQPQSLFSAVSGFLDFSLLPQQSPEVAPGNGWLGSACERPLW